MLYELVTKELPYLRRYARVISGNQMTGDLCVETLLLEHVITPQASDAHLPKDRIELFALLDEILVNFAPAPSLTEPNTAFQRLSFLSRRALFLTAVEQLDPTAVEMILKVRPHDLTVIMNETEKRLASSLATDVLIVKGTGRIALQLQEIVESLGHRIIAQANTRGDAVREARATRPGLMLVESQLADGSSGFGALDDIRKFHKAPSIVITSLQDRMRIGRDNEPAFLVSTPLQVDHVKSVICRALLAVIAG